MVHESYMSSISRAFIWSMFAAIFILSLQTVLQAQSKRMRAGVIAKAKTTLVSSLEKGMPREPFAVWFRQLAGSKTPIDWSINDCGEQTGTSEDRGRDFPMCVEVSARVSTHFYFSVNVQYGTFKRGITRGRPVVRSIFSGDENTRGGAYADTLYRLRQTLRMRKIDAEFFDPNNGVFYISGDKPRGFQDIEETYIQTKDLDDRKTAVKPNGSIREGRQEFAMRNIVYDGKHWSYETVTIGGVSFRFDGDFSKIELDEHGIQNGENILRGRLTKFVDGQKMAETDLVFSFVCQGE